MRKAFGGALCIALVGGLTATAIGGTSERVSHSAFGDGDARAALRATATYDGKLKRAGQGATISIQAKVRRGKATSIKSVEYENLPADCPVSPFDTISGGWDLSGVRVNDRRKFKAVGNDGGPPGMRSSLKFKGRFSKSFKRVRGTFQTSVYFPKDPEETCVGENKRYAASR